MSQFCLHCLICLPQLAPPTLAVFNALHADTVLCVVPGQTRLLVLGVSGGDGGCGADCQVQVLRSITLAHVACSLAMSSDARLLAVWAVGMSSIDCH